MPELTHSFSRATAALAAGLATMLAALALAASAQAATPGTFTTLASSPNPVNNVAVDPTTNIIYAQEYSGTGFYSYNPSTNTWTTLASAPISQGNNGGAAYLNGKIYTAYTNNSSQLGVYNIASGTWTTIANPLGIGTAVITAYNGLLYMADGTSFVSYDPATNTTHTLAAAPAFTTSDCSGDGYEKWGDLVPYQGKLYGTQGDGCNGFAVYDVASNTWSLLTFPPGDAILGAAIDPVTGTYYTYGPYGGSTFYAYDIAAGTWTTKTFPYSDLDDGGMAYVSTPGLQGIYATYGQGSTGFTRYNTVAPVDVSITKSASSKQVDKGKTFTYTLKVSNSSTTASPSTTVTDTLPSRVAFVSVTASQGTCSGTTTVTCDLGTVAAGGTATVTIKVKATRTGSATNTASVSTAYQNMSTSTSASATVKIVVPKLKLTVKPHSARAGQRTCFRFTATSGGKRVRGVAVRLSGHTAHTSGHGTARICLALKAGTYHAKATKSGYRAATAAIRIHAAPKTKPVFTG